MAKIAPGPAAVPAIKPKSNMRKELHMLLADDLAVIIFKESLSGFVARQSTYERLGLTKKQYHPRLAKLVELGLVAKLKGSSEMDQSAKPNVTTYMATPLGAMVYRWHVKLCDEMAVNATPIGLIFDLLNRHPGLSTKQVEELAKSLLVDGEVLEELFLHPESKWDMQLMEDEKTAIETICDAVAHATTKVQATAPAFPKEVVKAMSTLARSGTPVFVVTKDIEALQSPDSQTSAQSPANMTYPGKPLAVKARYASAVDKNFITVDEHFVIISETNPLDGSFLYGIKIHSDTLAVKFGSIFQGLWYAAQDLSAAGRRTEQPARQT
jgi:hypothetical protein